MKNQNSKKTGKKIWKLLTILFGLLFLICMIWLAAYLVQGVLTEKELEELKNAFVQEGNTKEAEKSAAVGDSIAEELTKQQEDDAGKELPESEEADLSAEYEIPQKKIDWAALQEKNQDIYAWITIPGTVIDYPVLQHPDEPDYYLQHNLDGSRGYPGCIYSQFYNSRDWDDPNTVLYGHNMKNGSMFAGLHQYEDSRFFEENPYVYIYSGDGVRVYRIFAAYEFSSAHLLLSFDMENPENFEVYLKGIFERDGMNDNFNRDISVTAEDKILTLETCISKKPDNRYLVQAVLVAEELID